MVRRTAIFIEIIDPPIPKPEEKYDLEIKKENELVRRWKVHIFQIELISFLTNAFDPFIQIIIGGNFFVGFSPILLN